MFGSGSSFGTKPAGGLFGSFNSGSNTTSMNTGSFGANNNAPAGGSMFGNTSATTGNAQNPNNDIEVPQCPDDSVQAMKFNPGGQNVPMLLAAGSWDFTCRVWQVSETGQVEPKAMTNVGAPILSLDWFDVSV